MIAFAWTIIVTFAAIGFISISEHSFAGEVIGFGVAGVTFWLVK